MALPNSGTLGIGQIAAEFGGAVPHSLSEYYAGGGLVPAGAAGINGPIPSSGQIKISDFYGASARMGIYNVEQAGSGNGTPPGAIYTGPALHRGWSTVVNSAYGASNGRYGSPAPPVSDQGWLSGEAELLICGYIYDTDFPATRNWYWGLKQTTSGDWRFNAQCYIDNTVSGTVYNLGTLATGSGAGTVTYANGGGNVVMRYRLGGTVPDSAVNDITLKAFRIIVVPSGTAYPFA